MIRMASYRDKYLANLAKAKAKTTKKVVAPKKATTKETSKKDSKLV